MRRAFSEPASRDGIAVVMCSTWARTSFAATSEVTICSDMRFSPVRGYCPSLAGDLQPYSGHGQSPRAAGRSAAEAEARSGETFEEGSGGADARQGQPAGLHADRAGAGGAAQPRDWEGHGRARLGNGAQAAAR